MYRSSAAITFFRFDVVQLLRDSDKVVVVRSSVSSFQIVCRVAVCVLPDVAPFCCAHGFIAVVQFLAFCLRRRCGFPSVLHVAHGLRDCVIQRIYNRPTDQCLRFIAAHVLDPCVRIAVIIIQRRLFALFRRICVYVPDDSHLLIVCQFCKVCIAHQISNQFSGLLPFCLLQCFELLRTQVVILVQGSVFARVGHRLFRRLREYILPGCLSQPVQLIRNGAFLLLADIAGGKHIVQKSSFVLFRFSPCVQIIGLLIVPTGNFLACLAQLTLQPLGHIAVFVNIGGLSGFLCGSFNLAQQCIGQTLSQIGQCSIDQELSHVVLNMPDIFQRIIYALKHRHLNQRVAYRGQNLFNICPLQFSQRFTIQRLLQLCTHKHRHSRGGRPVDGIAVGFSVYGNVQGVVLFSIQLVEFVLFVVLIRPARQHSIVRKERSKRKQRGAGERFCPAVHQIRTGNFASCRPDGIYARVDKPQRGVFLSSYQNVCRSSSEGHNALAQNSCPCRRISASHDTGYKVRNLVIIPERLLLCLSYGVFSASVQNVGVYGAEVIRVNASCVQITGKRSCVGIPGKDSVTRFHCPIGQPSCLFQTGRQHSPVFLHHSCKFAAFSVVIIATIAHNPVLHCFIVRSCRLSGVSVCGKRFCTFNASGRYCVYNGFNGRSDFVLESVYQFGTHITCNVSDLRSEVAKHVQVPQRRERFCNVRRNLSCHILCNLF